MVNNLVCGLHRTRPPSSLQDDGQSRATAVINKEKRGEGQTEVGHSFCRGRGKVRIHTIFIPVIWRKHQHSKSSVRRYDRFIARIKMRRESGRAPRR